MINNAEDLDRQLKPLVQKLSYENELKTILSRQAIDTVRSTLTVMREDLKKAATNKECSSCDNNIRMVGSTLGIFLDVLINEKQTVFFRDLLNDYLVVVNNWNIQCGKNKNIESHMGMLVRIRDMNTTLQDTITVAKNLLNKLQREQHYRPPAYELSKHYLLQLQKRLEEKKEEEAKS